MEITRYEAAAMLSPAMTRRQVGTLIFLAGIQPCGIQRTRHAGRPAYLYERDAIMAAHAQEAARTSKQFIDNDWIASALLGRGLIIADPEAGALYWPDGTRAEYMAADIYGKVKAGPERIAAHRVIWIAADGEIPYGIQINHINQLRWDNRRANLELVTMPENIRHGHGKPYLTRAEAMGQLANLEPEPPPPPSPWAALARTGGVFRCGG